MANAKQPYTDSLGRLCFPMMELEIPDVEGTMDLKDYLTGLKQVEEDVEYMTPPELIKLKWELERQNATITEPVSENRNPALDAFDTGDHDMELMDLMAQDSIE